MSIIKKIVYIYNVVGVIDNHAKFEPTQLRAQNFQLKLTCCDLEIWSRSLKVV